MQRPLEKSRALVRAGRGWIRRSWLRHAPRSFLLYGRATRQELGEAGEELAARDLVRAGFELLGRRVHTPHAEVDLWARREAVSWAIEAKTGRCRHLPGALDGRVLPGWDLRWRPALSLDPEQRQRLRSAAHYLGRCVHSEPAVALLEVFVDERARKAEVFAPVALASSEEDAEG